MNTEPLPFELLNRTYRIVLSFNENVPVTQNVNIRNPLYINNFGTCDAAKANAKLYLNHEDEVVIEKINHTEITISRFGRQYHLKSGKSIMLFKNDIISIEHSNIQIIRLTKSLSVWFPSPTYRRILSTIAAIFTLCNVYAVAYGQTPDNEGCQEGYSLCLNNNVYQCENHRWKLIEECQKPAYCYNGDLRRCHDITGYHPEPRQEKAFCKDVEPCTNGQYSCFGDTGYCRDVKEMYKCEDNKWVLAQKCDVGYKCNLVSETEAQCMKDPGLLGKPLIGEECSTGTKCDSENAIMTCHLGFWKYKEICKEPAICKEGILQAKCIQPENVVPESPENKAPEAQVPAQKKKSVWHRYFLRLK